MNKNILKIVLIVVLSLFFLIILDLIILKTTGFGPIFAVKTDGKNNSSLYYGVLYKAWKCDNEKPKDNVIKFFWQDYTCEINNGNNKNEYTIVDETGVCAAQLEEIARDDKFIYYFTCKKSETVFLVYNDKTKISVKAALKSNKITIFELKKLVPELIFIEVINTNK